MYKTLAFISTHIINQAVISEYIKLSKVKNCKCILAIDNTNLNILSNSPVTEKEFYGTKVTCFIFDKTIHNELHLPWYIQDQETDNFSKIMWYNCDYRFYYVKKFLPDFDYYWQFEYDIFCNGPSYQTFFDKYSPQTQDLLILNFRKEQIDGSWWWSKNTGWLYKYSPVYGSLFPIVRLTSAAIDYLYNQRIKQKQLYQNIKDAKTNNWPFCELFVPTELVNHGFTVFRLEEPQITWDKEYDLNENRLFEHPDNLLYHPVKGQFIEREKKLSAQISEIKKELSSLRNSTSYKIGRLITFPIRTFRDLLK